MFVSSVVADLPVMLFGLAYRRSVTCSLSVPSDLAVLTSMLTIRMPLSRICGIFRSVQACAVVPTCVWPLGVWWLPKGFR